MPNHTRPAHRLIAAILLLFGPVGSSVFAQGTIAPVGQQVFFTTAGQPCASCKVYFYAAGTSSPQDTYSDVTLTTPNTNPVVLNSAGRNPAGGIYLLPASYKIVLQTSAGSTIWSQDYVPAVPAMGAYAFPATQVPSTNANTLDDYEEGTWTPTLTGTGGASGQAYTTQAGQYVKIGRLVIASYTLNISTVGTVTTAAAIGGLPFTSDSTITYQSVQPVYFSALNTNFVNVNTVLPASSTTAQLVGNTAAAANNGTALVQANLTTGSILRGTIIYRASQ